MTVHGVKRTIEAYDGAADAVYRSDSLHEALDGARLCVLAVPLTPATEGLVGRDELETLADDAIVVNVARGPVLENDSLIAALDNGDIRAACLDVTDPEPLPEEHPLWSRDDVFITPHSAGLSEKYHERYPPLFREQYDRWCSGEQLRYRVV
jgi:D-2-hydroxyacid dehydrogenase (NADP+)